MCGQVWTTTPEGVYGAGEPIDLYIGFRFPILLESATAFLYINTVAGGERVSCPSQSESKSDTSANVFYGEEQEGILTCRQLLLSCSFRERELSGVRFRQASIKLKADTLTRDGGTKDGLETKALLGMDARKDF